MDIQNPQVGEVYYSGKHPITIVGRTPRKVKAFIDCGQSMSDTQEITLRQWRDAVEIGELHA